MMSKWNSKHLKMPSSSGESIVFEYSDPDGTRQEESFSLFRSATEQKSLIELAENAVSATRMTIIEGALRLQAELRVRAHSGGCTVATMCETSVLRDLNPWEIESFTDLVVLSKTLALIRETRPEKITYLGEKHHLNQCLREMAMAESVEFISAANRRVQRHCPGRLFKGIIRKSPLLHLLREVTVHCHIDRPDCSSSKRRPKIALVAPLAHFYVDESNPGACSSGYFGKLPEFLVESGYDVVLVHHPVATLTWRERRRLGEAISSISPETFRIAHLPSRPPISLRRALDSWRRWRTARGRVTDILKEMDDFANGSELGWLWTFLRPSVQSGLLGHQSLVALATKVVMDSDSGSFGDVDQWVVASENQTWEHAFVSARRQEGHTQFNAFIHVPVRPWDFRIFTLAGDIASGHQESERPTFDRLLLTSPLDEAALAPFVSGPHQIRAVEALRFRDVLPPFTSGTDNRATRSLLVLGDYDRLETELVTTIAETVANEPNGADWVEFRPHPLQAARDKDLADRVTDKGKKRPKQGSDVACVVASSRTSALYPYLHAGYPVVIALGRGSLNFCPILEFPLLRYLSDSSTGIHDYAPMGRTSTHTQRPHELLFLDKSLPRWRAALSLTPSSGSTDV